MFLKTTLCLLSVGYAEYYFVCYFKKGQTWKFILSGIGGKFINELHLHLTQFMLENQILLKQNVLPGL